MSSVQDIEKCPQCGGVYFSDFDCRTFEDYHFCNRCGKLEKHTVVWDENGKTVRDGDGQVKYDYTSEKGYGCLAIAVKEGFRRYFRLDHPVDEELRKTYLQMMKESEINQAECYLTSWDEQMNEIITVYGKLPSSYDEYMNESDGDEAESE